MKFDILHNTVRTAHFDALQSMFRAAETASAASRRATKHLVHRTLPSSPLPPSSLDVRAAVCDDTFATPLQIFFEQPLRRYPYDRCVIEEHDARPAAARPAHRARVTMRCTSRCAANRHAGRYASCRARKRRRPQAAGVGREQMGIDDARVRLRTSPNRRRRPSRAAAPRQAPCVRAPAQPRAATVHRARRERQPVRKTPGARRPTRPVRATCPTCSTCSTR